MLTIPSYSSVANKTYITKELEKTEISILVNNIRMTQSSINKTENKEIIYIKNIIASYLPF